jgi:uracil-DNA glycosylase
MAGRAPDRGQAAADGGFDALLASIRACARCEGLPLGPKPIVQADAAARILIVGQAPGRLAHMRGRPFDDPSGDRLRDWLGVGRATFYDPARFAIAPMGFCFPGTAAGGDLPPRPECAAHWRAPLLAALPRIELTLAVGRYAHRWSVAGAAGMTVAETVRGWRDHWPRCLPTPHPSPRNLLWLKRNPWFEAEAVPALRARVAAILAT